jgi:uncharacterized membrane protein
MCMCLLGLLPVRIIMGTQATTGVGLLLSGIIMGKQAITGVGLVLMGLFIVLCFFISIYG